MYFLFYLNIYEIFSLLFTLLEDLLVFLNRIYLILLMIYQPFINDLLLLLLILYHLFRIHQVMKVFDLLLSFFHYLRSTSYSCFRHFGYRMRPIRLWRLQMEMSILLLQIVILLFLGPCLHIFHKIQLHCMNKMVFLLNLHKLLLKLSCLYLEDRIITHLDAFWHLFVYTFQD